MHESCGQEVQDSTTGEKLDDWVKTLGDSIGLQYGLTSGLTKANPSPEGRSTFEDSLEDTPPPTSPRDTDERRRVMKEIYGVSPPPQRAVPKAAASRACVEIVSSQEVEASPVKRALKAIAGRKRGEGEKRTWKWEGTGTG